MEIFIHVETQMPPKMLNCSNLFLFVQLLYEIAPKDAVIGWIRLDPFTPIFKYGLKSGSPISAG